MSGMILLPQAENIMFLELDVSPPAVFEMEFSHDQEQDPRALHMERLMRLDSFLERPSTSKVRKSRSWLVPSWSEWAVDFAQEAGELHGRTQRVRREGDDWGCGEELLQQQSERKLNPHFSVSCTSPTSPFTHFLPTPCRCQSPQRPPPSTTHASLASAALRPATVLDHE